MTTQLPSRAALQILLGLHLAAGFVCGLTAFSLSYSLSIRHGGHPLVELGYLAFIGSELLLLGIWAGLARSRWWLKLLGLAGGILWLAIVSLAADPNVFLYPQLHARAFQEVPAVLGAIVLIVAGAFWLARQTFVQLEHRSEWTSPAVGQEVRFSLLSICCLTAAIAVVLAGGRIVSAANVASGFEYLEFALVTAVCALFTTWLLVWASLGPGQLMVRLPLLLLGAALLGLIPPYYLANPGQPWWRFLTWPLITVFIAALSSGSLLVVRRLGYRVVPIGRRATG